MSEDKSPFDELYDRCIELQSENEQLVAENANIELWKKIRQLERDTIQIGQLRDAVVIRDSRITQLVEALEFTKNILLDYTCADCMPNDPCSRCEAIEEIDTALEAEKGTDE